MKSIADAHGDLDAVAEATASTRTLTNYRTPAKVFHWLTAGLVVVMVSLGVAAKQLEGSGAADTLLLLHKTLGIVTLVVVVMRVIYRLTGRSPAGAAQSDTRPIVHWMLYAVIIAVPLLGWAGVSDFGAREILFGYKLPPIWPEHAGYADLLLPLHAYVAFALLALVALHIGLAMQDYMTCRRSDASRRDG